MNSFLRNKKVLILGGAGFVGKSIVKNLLDLGVRVVVISRFYNKLKFSKLFGQPGQLEIISANIFEQGILEKYIIDKFAVINLCGILFEREANDFEKIHAYLPSLISNICKNYHIPKLIHFSALGVSKNSSSLYARSKAYGESRVLKIYKNANILRPSIIYGEGDNFFGKFEKISKFSPFLPVIGPNVKFQPVFVTDVARAVVKLLESNTTTKTIYELGGDKLYTFESLMNLMLKILNRRRFILKLNPKLMILPGYFFKFLPNPPFTSDQMKLLMKDNLVNLEMPSFKDLKIVTSDLEDVLPDILKLYKV